MHKCEIFLHLNLSRNDAFKFPGLGFSRINKYSLTEMFLKPMNLRAVPDFIIRYKK